MDLLFVPKPLFDRDVNVQSYYFSYQFGNAILEAAKPNPLDGAMHSPFIELLNQVGLEALTQSKPIFIPVNNVLLMTDLEKACFTEPEKVVFLLGKDTSLNAQNLIRVRRFKDMGYRVALRGYDDINDLASFLPDVDYVFLSLPQAALRKAINEIKIHNRNIAVIAADIETDIAFDKLKDIGASLFDGPFYKVHIPVGTRQAALSPLRVNYIQLLNIVNQNDFDYKKFSHIVRQDTALAVQFLRLVNSSRRLNSEIKTINHAAAMIGEREIKKWISTAVSTALCTEHPSEVARVSLIRARFCENLARFFELGIWGESLFLTGLFSVLDVILELPIEEALNRVYVPEPIRRALAYGQGELSRVLAFVLVYEHGDWYEVSRLAMVLNISIADIHDAYSDALIWYSDLINTPEGDPDEIQK